MGSPMAPDLTASSPLINLTCKIICISPCNQPNIFTRIIVCLYNQPTIPTFTITASTQHALRCKSKKPRINNKQSIYASADAVCIRSYTQPNTLPASLFGSTGVQATKHILASRQRTCCLSQVGNTTASLYLNNLRLSLSCCSLLVDACELPEAFAFCLVFSN